MLEQVEQDEIENVCEEISDTMEGAFTVLLERRDTRYANEIAGLESEEVELRKEYAAITEASANLAELLPARMRMAQTEHDRLLLAGDREGAAVKLAEQKEAEAAGATMKARQQASLTMSALSSTFEAH